MSRPKHAYKIVIKFSAPHARLSRSGLYYAQKKRQNRQNCRRSKTVILDLPTMKQNYWQHTSNTHMNLLRQVSVCFEVQSGEQLRFPYFWDIMPRHLTIGSWRFKATQRPKLIAQQSTVISRKKRIFKFLSEYEASTCESPVAILYCQSVLLTCNTANCSNVDLL
jgi:UDP-N-acetyl-D-mannosaminuronic acid transferase (WecB/TagA/CpsF family)